PRRPRAPARSVSRPPGVPRRIFGDMPTPADTSHTRDPGPPARPPAPGAAGPPPEAPLWAEGEFWLRVRDRPSSENRVGRIPRPFALVGRITGADVLIDDRAVSARHLYLHLDRRGLYAVDLATRTGTRFGDAPSPSGWLRPGDVLDVAGHRIELMDL